MSNRGNFMVTAASLRERAEYYQKLAETTEMSTLVADLRILARTFEADAAALEQPQGHPPST
jgi:hypothetical protein